MEIGKRAPQLRRGTPPAPARIAGNAPEIFGNLNRKPARRALRVLFSDPTKRGFPRAPRQKKRAAQAEIRGSKAPAPPVKIPRPARKRGNGVCRPPLFPNWRRKRPRHRRRPQAKSATSCFPFPDGRAQPRGVKRSAPARHSPAFAGNRPQTQIHRPYAGRRLRYAGRLPGGADVGEKNLPLGGVSSPNAGAQLIPALLPRKPQARAKIGAFFRLFQKGRSFI